MIEKNRNFLSWGDEVRMTHLLIYFFSALLCLIVLFLVNCFFKALRINEKISKHDNLLSRILLTNKFKAFYKPYHAFEKEMPTNSNFSDKRLNAMESLETYRGDTSFDTTDILMKPSKYSIESLRKDLEDTPLDTTNIPEIKGVIIKRRSLCNKLGEHDLIIHDLTEAIQADESNNYFYYYLRHLEYISLGNKLQAFADIKQAVELMPSGQNYRYYKDLALLYKEFGELEKAIDTMNCYVQLFPKDREPYLDRAEFFYGIGRLEAAVSDLTTAFKLRPDGLGLIVLHKRIKIYIEMKKFDKALDDCNYCIKRAPGDSGHYSIRAQVYKAMGYFDLAKIDDDKSMSIKRQR